MVELQWIVWNSGNFVVCVVPWVWNINLAYEGLTFRGGSRNFAKHWFTENLGIPWNSRVLRKFMGFPWTLKKSIIPRKSVPWRWHVKTAAIPVVSIGSGAWFLPRTSISRFGVPEKVCQILHNLWDVDSFGGKALEGLINHFQSHTSTRPSDDICI